MRKVPSRAAERERWLLLIHQVPPKPDYLRVKVRRRLDRMGAVALKNSVYVLPRTDEAVEDFQWLLREIVAEGGEASVCEAAFIEGITDENLVRAFQEARDIDYAEIAEAARALGSAGPAEQPEGDWPGQAVAQSSAGVARLRRRLHEVAAIDFFGAPGRALAADEIEAAEARLRPAPHGSTSAAQRPHGADLLRGRTWVTRRGVHVDRIASAWLIRRFIDPEAHFKFVPPKGYRPAAGELRFDMFEAEYTHEGDRCTFETLLERFQLRDRALQALGEVVHDIDLKESKFGRQETAGIAALIDGITLAHPDDETRVERGAAALDALYETFRRQLGRRGAR